MSLVKAANKSLSDLGLTAEALTAGVIIHTSLYIDIHKLSRHTGGHKYYITSTQNVFANQLTHM